MRTYEWWMDEDGYPLGDGMVTDTEERREYEAQEQFKREIESTEMVKCSYCGEMVDSEECEYIGCWIGACCIDIAWERHIERSAFV